jgi:hypothetical protein
LGLHRISRRGAVVIAGCALVLPVTAGSALAAYDLSTSGSSQGQPSGHVHGEISPEGGSLKGSGSGGGERLSGSGEGSRHGVSGEASGPAGSGSMMAGPHGGSGEVCGPDGTCRGGSVPPSDAQSPDAEANSAGDGAAFKGRFSPKSGSASGSGSLGGEEVSGSGEGSRHGVSGEASGPAGSGSMEAGPHGGSGEVCGPDGTCHGGSVPPSDR